MVAVIAAGMLAVVATVVSVAVAPAVSVFVRCRSRDLRRSHEERVNAVRTCEKGGLSLRLSQFALVVTLAA